MIPDKTPALAAIAWITVVMAYAWASNRDYEDAVLTHHAPTTVGRNKPQAFAVSGVERFPANVAHPPETAKALFRPTPHTGDRP